MTSKEFKIWLDGFLTPLNLEQIEVREDYGTSYNHLTMLKTIHKKLKDIEEISEVERKTSEILLTERFTPTPPPNPFEIKFETKKEE
tara:strand:- start:483 stop:743 length:261 start_codon:yes stop_codon:yes gene_type:complete